MCLPAVNLENKFQTYIQEAIDTDNSTPQLIVAEKNYSCCQPIQIAQIAFFMAFH